MRHHTAHTKVVPLGGPPFLLARENFGASAQYYGVGLTLSPDDLVLAMSVGHISGSALNQLRSSILRGTASDDTTLFIRNGKQPNGETRWQAKKIWFDALSRYQMHWASGQSGKILQLVHVAALPDQARVWTPGGVAIFYTPPFTENASLVLQRISDATGLPVLPAWREAIEKAAQEMDIIAPCSTLGIAPALIRWATPLQDLRSFILNAAHQHYVQQGGRHDTFPQSHQPGTEEQGHPGGDCCP